METTKEANGNFAWEKETAGKTFARAYCHTEGQWIDEWDTHFEIALKNKKTHEQESSHSVTVHYK